MDDHIQPERRLFCDVKIVNPTDVLGFVIENNTEHDIYNE